MTKRLINYLFLYKWLVIFEALKGASPAEAEAKRKVKESRMSAMAVAREAGIEIKAPDLKRKTLVL
jgi:hypothetical protein